jgi:hypothetical protein
MKGKKKGQSIGLHLLLLLLCNAICAQSLRNLLGPLVLAEFLLKFVHIV